MPLAAVCVMIAIAALWHARAHQTPTKLKLAGASSIVLAVAVTPFMTTGSPEVLARLFQALVVLGALAMLAGVVLARRQEAGDYRAARMAGRQAQAPRWPTGLVWLVWFLLCAAISYAVMAGMGAYTDASMDPLIESAAPLEEIQRTAGGLAAVYVLAIIPCILAPFVVPTVIAWRYDRGTKVQHREL